MADCVCLPKCLFFHDKMADMPAMSDIYKKKYCQEDSSDCARHMVFSKTGPEGVPFDLYPNDQARATTLLAKAGF